MQDDKPPAPRKRATKAKATPKPATKPASEPAAKPAPKKTARKASPRPAAKAAAVAVPEVPEPVVPAARARKTQAVERQPAAEVPAAVEREAAAVALWPAIKNRPGDAPELLALAAVHRLGEEARADVSWLRETYPTATPDGLARLCARRFVRQAYLQGAVAGFVGPLALLAESAGLLFTHARLVLHVAAAYGVDPTDPARAADLLVLEGFHPDVPTADAALARALRPSDIVEPARNRAGTLARVAGRSLVKVVVARRASRLVPGAGAVVAALVDGRTAERLAIKAARLYRLRAQ